MQQGLVERNGLGHLAGVVGLLGGDDHALAVGEVAVGGQRLGVLNVTTARPSG